MRHYTLADCAQQHTARRRRPCYVFAMMRLVLGALAAAVIVVCPTAPRAAETPEALSETLGDEISRAERDAYHLFPDVRGFVSARVFKLDHGYRVDIVYEDGGTQHTRSRRIDDDIKSFAEVVKAAKLTFP